MLFRFQLYVSFVRKEIVEFFNKRVFISRSWPKRSSCRIIGGSNCLLFYLILIMSCGGRIHYYA